MLVETEKMKYYDYEWELDENGIAFDQELNIDRLGWKHGDYFRITNANGKAMLVKVDPVVKFLKEGEIK